MKRTLPFFKPTAMLTMAVVIMLLTGGLCSKALAKAEAVIKLGHCDTHIGIVESPYLAYSETFKSIVEVRTDGRIEVQIVPNSQLGDLRSQMEQTARGTMQVTAGMTVDLLASYEPNIHYQRT